ncbi:MAG: hypothetical protein ACHP91_05085, partial [Burkholderiales bacterium]
MGLQWRPAARAAKLGGLSASPTRDNTRHSPQKHAKKASMILSMTGFAAESADLPGVALSVELR